MTQMSKYFLENQRHRCDQCISITAQTTWMSESDMYNVIRTLELIIFSDSNT